MSISVGKAIRELNSNKISPSYFLSGNDYFLQKFFIKRLMMKFDNTLKPKYLNFTEEDDRKFLLGEIENISLFSNKGIYIIRNFNKVSSKIKDVLIDYINRPLSDNILIFISEDFYAKNKFLTILSKQSYMIDTRTPFSNKVREWVDYYIKTEKLKIDKEVVDELIDSFNDSISLIINEIEKLYLFNKGLDIKYKDFNQINEKKQNIRPWNFINNIGSKNVNQSIDNLNVLFLNGYNIIVLIMSLSNFFKVLLLENLSADYNKGYNGLNKIINNKMKYYSNNFSVDEISNIIISIKNIDVLCKTTSLNHKDMLLVLITRICRGYYAK